MADQTTTDGEPRFTDQEFADLLAWFMASDPNPAGGHVDNRMREMLRGEAKRRGFDGWVEAYHGELMEEAEQ